MKKCPRCGRRRTAQIEYGGPDCNDGLKQKIRLEELVVDAFNDFDNHPEYYCFECKKGFGTSRIVLNNNSELNPNAITAIHFTNGGYFGGYDEIFIRKTDNGNLLECAPGFQRKTLPVSRQMTDEEWNRLLYRLFCQLYVHEWEETYNDYSVLDGEQWSLELFAKDSVLLKSSGSNAFPAYWNELKRTFQAFLNEGVIKICPYLTDNEDDGLVIFRLERSGKPSVYAWVINEDGLDNAVQKISSFYGVVSYFTHICSPLTIARFAKKESLNKATRKLKSFPKEKFMAMLEEADLDIEHKRKNPDEWKEYIEWEASAKQLIEEVAGRGETNIIF